MLEESYYSGTPYSFGEHRIIKWHARPFKTITSLMPEHPKDNFLRDRLIRDLSEDAKDPVAFGLFVQFQENDQAEPIDDSTVDWKTPFCRVATIILPRQHVNTPARGRLDEKMSFSPGNAIVAHAPLGSVNRIRVEVYGEMAKERLNHPVPYEPLPV
jgi:catalase